jgi:hypothetical protein
MRQDDFSLQVGWSAVGNAMVTNAYLGNPYGYHYLLSFRMPEEEIRAGSVALPYHIPGPYVRGMRLTEIDWDLILMDYDTEAGDEASWLVVDAYDLDGDDPARYLVEGRFAARLVRDRREVRGNVLGDTVAVEGRFRLRSHRRGVLFEER